MLYILAMSIINNSTSTDLLIEEVEAKAGRVEAGWLRFVTGARLVLFGLAVLATVWLLLALGGTWKPYTTMIALGVLSVTAVIVGWTRTRGTVGASPAELFCFGLPVATVLWVVLAGITYLSAGYASTAGIAAVATVLWVGCLACAGTVLIYKVNYPLTGPRLRKAEIDAL